MVSTGDSGLCLLSLLLCGAVMAVTWEIDLEYIKDHANNVVLREKNDGKVIDTYIIRREPGDTIVELRNKAKVMINARRAKRAKVEQIKAQFDSAQFEAFLNS